MRNRSWPVRLVIANKPERWGCPVRRCYLEAACRHFVVRKDRSLRTLLGGTKALLLFFVYIVRCLLLFDVQCFVFISAILLQFLSKFRARVQKKRKMETRQTFNVSSLVLFSNFTHYICYSIVLVWRLS